MRTTETWRRGGGSCRPILIALVSPWLRRRPFVGVGSLAAGIHLARLPGLGIAVVQGKVAARIGRAAEPDLVPGVGMRIVDAGDLPQGDVEPPAVCRHAPP